MAKQRIARSLLVVGLLLLMAMLAVALCSHTHASPAALPLVCLLCIGIVLPLLALASAQDSAAPPRLRPSFGRVLLQLPPPHILP